MRNFFGILILGLIGLSLSNCKNEPEKQATSLIKAKQEADLTKFEESIKKFESQDSIEFPPSNAVLFTGSSSIAMWSTLSADMDPIPVINRGFGGSTIPEVNHYADRIVIPYQPQLIVFYCGENDINAGTITTTVFQNYKKFVGMVQEELPDTEILFLSMKPSMDRWAMWEKFEKGNDLIRQFSEQHDQLHYLNVGDIMLNEAGTPDTTIFIQDGLHMNASGYERWTALIKPVVEEMYRVEG